MIFTVKNTKDKNVRVYDAAGNIIPYAYYYNTKTKVVGVYVTAKRGDRSTIALRSQKSDYNTAVRVKVKIPGSYIEVNGKLIK